MDEIIWNVNEPEMNELYISDIVNDEDAVRNIDIKFEKKQKFRIRLFGMLVLLAFAALGTRLYYIQIIGHEALSEAAFKQQTIRLILTDFETQEAAVSLDELLYGGRYGSIEVTSDAGITGISINEIDNQEINIDGESEVKIDGNSSGNDIKTAANTFEYLYLIKHDTLAGMGARENEYYSLMEKVYGERLAGAANDYIIYGSHFYNEAVGERLKNKFGALVIKNADEYGDDLVYAYADRDGNFLSWMPIVQLKSGIR